MYLSRVEIDDVNRRKTKNLNHLGAYHNWVERSFPKEILNGEYKRKLWRIDKLRGKRYLLLVSEGKPNLELLEVYGVANTAVSKPYDDFLNRLKDGQNVRFKVTLNPVMSISSGKLSGKRGRVVPHITIEQKMKFLKSKEERNGFKVSLDDFYITESNYEILKKEGMKQVRISKVTYEGKLTITDKAIFKEMMKKGLGKKKAYGCGMMTVIPYR